ncbi:hypothetical protein D3C71_1482300 [compost metagenome]
MGAEVQVGQLAIEQPRDHAGDRMRLPHQHLSVLCAQTFDLGRQRLVVGLPVALQPALDLGCIGLASGLVERVAVEGGERAQSGGVLARVETLAARGAVQVDDVARDLGAQHAGAQRSGHGVDLVQVPVAVTRLQGLVRVDVPELLGNRRAQVRNRDQQGHAALVQLVRGRFDGGAHGACEELFFGGSAPRGGREICG